MSNLCSLFYMIHTAKFLLSCLSGRRKYLNNFLLLFCAGWDSDQSGRFITFSWDLYSLVQPVALQADCQQKKQWTKWRIHVSVKQAGIRLTGLGEQCVGYYCNSKKNPIDSNCAVALWLLEYVSCPTLKVQGPVVLQAFLSIVPLCGRSSYMGFQAC